MPRRNGQATEYEKLAKKRLSAKLAERKAKATPKEEEARIKDKEKARALEKEHAALLLQRMVEEAIIKEEKKQAERVKQAKREEIIRNIAKYKAEQAAKQAEEEEAKRLADQKEREAQEDAKKESQQEESLKIIKSLTKLSEALQARDIPEEIGNRAIGDIIELINNRIGEVDFSEAENTEIIALLQGLREVEGIGNIVNNALAAFGAEEDYVMANIAPLLEEHELVQRITDLERMVVEYGGIKEEDEGQLIVEEGIDEAAALQIGGELNRAGGEGNQALQTLIGHLAAGGRLTLAEGVTLPGLIDRLAQNAANRAREQEFINNLLEGMRGAREPQEDAENITVEEGLTLTPETGAIIIHPMVQEAANINIIRELLARIGPAHQEAEEDGVLVEPVITHVPFANGDEEGDGYEMPNAQELADLANARLNQEASGGIMDAVSWLWGGGGK